MSNGLRAGSMRQGEMHDIIGVLDHKLMSEACSFQSAT